MLEENYEDNGLSLRDLVFLAKKNILLILIVTLICTLIGAIYGLGFKETKYTASASAIVMAESSSATKNGYQDYLYSNYLMNTFQEFVVSNPVIELVRSDLSKNKLTINEIINSTTISVGTNSVILNIKSVTNDRQLSIDMVNSILNNAIKVANQTREDGEYKYSILANKITDMEYATEATGSRGASIVIVVSFVIGLVISFAIILIKYLMADTYSSKEEFERDFNINVLAMVPEITGEEDE